MELRSLIGKKVTRLYANEDYMRFVCDDGYVLTIYAEGDCCSHTVFYDFYGVQNLLRNGSVKAVYEVPLKQDVPQQERFAEEMSVYGIAFVTENKWGEVTSVFSFRNYSNGYYGGSIEKSDFKGELPEITEDVVEIINTITPPHK